jgi:hypothetical protein
MLMLMIDMLISHNIALCLFSLLPPFLCPLPFALCPLPFALCPLPFALCAFCLCCLSASLSLSASCLSAPEKSLCLKKACLSRASVRRLCVKASVRAACARLSPNLFPLLAAIGHWQACPRSLPPNSPSVRPSVRPFNFVTKKKIERDIVSWSRWSLQPFTFGP